MLEAPHFPAQRQQQTQLSQQRSTQKSSDRNQTDNTGIAKARKGQWQVSSEPGDRETLANSAGERFPARYERQLSGYYRNLAEGQNP